MLQFYLTDKFEVTPHSLSACPGPFSESPFLLVIRSLSSSSLLQTSHISVSGNLLESQVPPQTYWSKSSLSQDSQGVCMLVKIKTLNLEERTPPGESRWKGAERFTGWRTTQAQSWRWERAGVFEAGMWDGCWVMKSGHEVMGCRALNDRPRSWDFILRETEKHSKVWAERERERGLDVHRALGENLCVH